MQKNGNKKAFVITIYSRMQESSYIAWERFEERKAVGLSRNLVYMEVTTVPTVQDKWISTQ